MEQCLELGEGQHERIDGGADIADISHVADWCQSNARRNVHMIQKAPSTPAWSCPRCSTCNWGSAKSYHRDATDKADLWWGGSTWDFDHVRVIFPVLMPGDRRCLPKYLQPEHGACSTRDAGGKCHYRSQPKILSHRLLWRGAARHLPRYLCLRAPSNKSSINFIPAIHEGWANRRWDGAIWHLSYIWRASARLGQHVPMCTQGGSCPEIHPIL